MVQGKLKKVQGRLKASLAPYFSRLFNEVAGLDVDYLKIKQKSVFFLK